MKNVLFGIFGGVVAGLVGVALFNQALVEKVDATFVPSVDGVCGQEVNTCTAGTFEDRTDTSTEYKWKCEGSGIFGDDAYCSAPKPVSCDDQFTYEKREDFDDSKVNINFQDGDHAITVTAKEGYALVSVQLDVDDDGHGGFWTYPVVNGVKYNPSGNDINEAKVVVKKVCESTPPPAPACTENCGSAPTFAGSSTEAPQCPNGSTTNVVANPHVLRAGEAATVNFFITEGSSANIFYSEVGLPHWQHAVADVKPNGDRFVSYTIHGLNPALGYDFGIMQKEGCGGGKTTAVVVDGPQSRLFQLSYWE